MVDRSYIGHVFTPTTAAVEEGRLRFFLRATSDMNSAFRPDGAALVPPTYLFCLEMMDSAEPFEFVDALGIDLAHVLHAEQGFTYYAPVHVGDRLTFRTQVTDVFERKGGALTFVVQDTTVTNQDGVHVADLRRSLAVRNAPRES